MKTARMIMVRFNDMKTFSEQFLNKNWHNGFTFWFYVWCLHYKAPSCQSKGITIHIIFFVDRWIMVLWVLFDFLYQCSIYGLYYFVLSFGNDDTLLIYFNSILIVWTVRIQTPTRLYVLLSKSCMCYDQRVIGSLHCINVYRR